MSTKQTVLDFFSAEDEEECARNLYKSTDCGAWIEFDEYRITLGSIVEGCNFGTSIYPLYYDHDFTGADIQARIDAIEAEADAIWKWANGETSDGKTAAEMGVDCPDIGSEFIALDPDGVSA